MDSRLRGIPEAEGYAPVLRTPNFTAPFQLQTDASERGMEAIPSQKDEEGADPILVGSCYPASRNTLR